MHAPEVAPELLFAVQSEADAPVERAARFGGLVPFVDGDVEGLRSIVERYRSGGGSGAIVVPRVAAWGAAWDALLAELEPDWVLHCEDRDAAALAEGPPTLG